MTLRPLGEGKGQIRWRLHMGRIFERFAAIPRRFPLFTPQCGHSPELTGIPYRRIVFARFFTLQWDSLQSFYFVCFALYL